MKREREEELEEDADEDELAADLEAALEEDDGGAAAEAERPAVQPDTGVGGSAPLPEELAGEQADTAAGAVAAEKGPPDEDTSREDRNRLNQQILKLLTPEQIDRYEAYRRSSLNRRNMKRLIQSITSQTANPNTVIVMCGIAKMFLGDLIETGRAIAHEQGETGPLRPLHIQAAYQQLDKQGQIPHPTPPKRMRL